jgi:hypothetical protein
MRIRGGGMLAPGLVATWLLTGCVTNPPDKGDAHDPGTPDSSALTAMAASGRQDSLEPGALGTVRAVLVEGWTGPGGRLFEVAVRTRDVESGHARRFGTITLRTTLRGPSPDLVQYPCTSCHLGRTVAMKDNRIRDAHQNIQPLHPDLLGAVCSTCHSPDAVDSLALRTRQRVGLDNGYRLCAQCHFRQADDWAAGAHGKRLDGWQGRRVVMGCTDCHDPHRPAPLPRIPFRAPTLSRPGGHD